MATDLGPRAFDESPFGSGAMRVSTLGVKFSCTVLNVLFITFSLFNRISVKVLSILHLESDF